LECYGLYKIKDSDSIAYRRKQTRSFRVKEEIASTIYCPEQVGELSKCYCVVGSAARESRAHLEVCLHIRIARFLLESEPVCWRAEDIDEDE